MQQGLGGDSNWGISFGYRQIAFCIVFYSFPATLPLGLSIVCVGRCNRDKEGVYVLVCVNVRVHICISKFLLPLH